MAMYYDIFDAEHNFKRIDSGKFVGMPFFWTKDKMPVDIPMVFGKEETFIGVQDDIYNGTALIGRDMAIEIQKYMTEGNPTIFTDWMDENHTDTLIIRTY